MSALAHYFEEEGLPSVAISLIRPQAERTHAPRALWVPFELGRPFGPPNDPAFQTRVVLAALRLLESPNGPVLLEDFPDDDPRAQPDPSWLPPVGAPAKGDEPPDTLAGRLVAEVQGLGSRHMQALVQRNGRSTAGLSGLTAVEAGRYVGDFLRGRVTTSPSPDVSPVLALRFAIDDLKAYYTEAACTGTAKPSSRQVGDWFWNQTVAGAMIMALRKAHLASQDERLKLIAGMFLVPGARVPPGE